MRLTIEGPGGLTSVSLAINPAEEMTLRRYLADYDRLRASSPLASQLPCEVSITPSDDGGATVTAKLPTEDDRAILLHRMRPFILEKEPASFPRVSSLLARRVSQPVIRKLLSDQRLLWDGRAFASQGLIRLNGRKINPGRYFSAWLNAEEYHRDPEKNLSFTSLRRSATFPLFEWVVVNVLLDKVRAVSNVAALIGVILGESPQFQVAGHRLRLGDV
jgi:hypothetical protein